MSTPKRIDLVCPRCGKTRSLRYSPQGRKTPMCQPCAVALTIKRQHAATRLWLDDETIEEKLGSFSK